MRQTELQLSDEDRLVVEEFRCRGLHHLREVNRAHLLMFRNLRVEVLVMLVGLLSHAQLANFAKTAVGMKPR